MKCATTECTDEQTGKSKYCPECKVIAREKWQERVGKVASDGLGWWPNRHLGEGANTLLNRRKQ